MASNFNIDAEKCSTDDNLKLPITFSNTSCFGEMWGRTLNSNDTVENKDLRDILEILDLDGACASVVADEDDIPVITFKNKKKTEFDPVLWEKYQESQRIMSLQILDVLASTMIAKKPSLYSFNNNIYRYVQIVGTVVSRKSTIENKLTIGVDDGSGHISCIVDNSESEIQHRTDLNKLEESSFKYEAMNKEEFLQLASLDSAEFHEKIKDKDQENAFLVTLTRITLEHTKKQLEEYPVIAEINIGDNIIIVGAVADFKDQRLIFVKHLKRDRNLDDYKYHMINSMKYKVPK